MINLSRFTLFGLLAQALYFTNTSLGDCTTNVQIKYIAGLSMSELYKPEQKIEVDLNYYNCHEPKRGEVILFNHTKNRPRPLIKLIVAQPGDQFALNLAPGNLSYNLIVNKNTVKTPRGIPYQFEAKTAKILQLYQKSLASQIPPGLYLVLGTEPHGSLDSSKFGPVERSSILGKVLTP